MYYNDNSASECFFSMLIVGAMSWLTHRAGRQSAFKEVEEAISRDEVKYLKNEINRMKGNQGSQKKGDQWDDLRRALKLPTAS